MVDVLAAAAGLIEAADQANAVFAGIPAPTTAEPEQTEAA
jgi:hypothetical protein